MPCGDGSEVTWSSTPEDRVSGEKGRCWITRDSPIFGLFEDWFGESRS
jgi:hypothetical protein